MPKIKPPARPVTLRVRLSAAERKAFEMASQFDGLDLSAWCRMVLRRAAATAMREVGKDAGL